MKKAILVAVALSTASIAAAPAFAQDRDHREDAAWTPQITMRHGHHGYWDEHHHWRAARFVMREGHRGYWDHHHSWHEWNG